MPDATAKQAVDVFVQRIMHEAHLRYQREKLKAEKPLMPLTPKGVTLDCSEVRGVRRRLSPAEQRRAASKAFKPEWFTGLRPNFYKGYFDTLRYMVQP